MRLLPHPTENDLPVSVRAVAGLDILPLLPDLARLRIDVFREWPYIYDGDVAHEEQYLRTYANAPGAAVIIAEADQKIVGAATCLPMQAATPNVQKPFSEHGWDISKIFYFGESVLLKSYRGRGIGVKFFAAREAQAAGFEIATFCGVQRPATHPLRDPDYTPLDSFWTHRGYTRHPELSCRMTWRDVGDAEETEKTLVFWTRSLTR
ncbi:GNAT family N-acetyltransferase [Acidocella sp.]|jgi:GNAT superfamily N-acetyltransferase|uniref:GNAT family N-acetyltransferase n=1 Tax=Acidocella sp. TaxID=50710 RepID=UPI0038CF972A